MINRVLAERYKIIEKIGSGGSADVYLAEDIKLQRKVAVKILSPLYANNRNFVIRFKKEAQTLARLNDPNIVAIFDWGQVESSYYICMEYVKGLSLSEIIEKQGIINPITAVKYSIQICNALEVAHKNNLIHRDIKPQNIIVSTDGTVKITDFGIAKSLLEDNTKTLNILGTSYYISPEQAQGKLLSYATDIYSLGIVFYEMLTADVPFRGENSIEISLKHINENPIRPTILVPEIPKKIEKIVLICLQKDPQKRYESAAALKADLINFLEGKPLKDEIQEENIISSQRSLISKIGSLKFLKKENIRNKNYDNYKKNRANKEEILNKKNKRLRIINWFVLTPVLVFLLIFSAWTFINYSLLKNHEELIVVPHIISMNYNAAETMLDSINLKMVVLDKEFSDNLPKDCILTQRPKAGESLKKDSVIEVSISKGAQKAQSAVLPNLIGINIEEARKILKELGFENQELKWEPSDYYDKDIVLKQEPGWLKTVDFKEKIILYASSGRELFLVPDLLGYDLLTGLSSLESQGFEIIIEKIRVEGSVPGTIINTSPAPGTEVKEGSLLKIFISTSEEMIEVPDVTKLNLENAVSILESMGINYEIGNTQILHNIQKNIVQSQYPEAGNFISPQEKLLIIVGI